MGGKTKKSKQRTRTRTTFEPLPLGKPAFFGQQEELFGRVGDILGQRLDAPLTSPGFAQGRDILSRRTESQKRSLERAPGIFAGTRRGAARDIEAAGTRSLSELIGFIQQDAIKNALAFATGPIQRGAVGATSTSGTTTVSQPGQTFGENLAGFGNIFGEQFASRLGGTLGGEAGGGIAGFFKGGNPASAAGATGGGG